MTNFLNEWYDWIKALHVIAVVAWMAGILYLPRLYVYHADAEPGSELSETLKIMERRLLRVILNPAMILSYFFGLCILFTPGVIDFGQYWIWVKLFFAVFGLGSLHVCLAKWRREFETDSNDRPARFYRWMNEVPAILMVGVVICAVVRPF